MSQWLSAYHRKRKIEENSKKREITAQMLLDLKKQHQQKVLDEITLLETRLKELKLLQDGF